MASMAEGLKAGEPTMPRCSRSRLNQSIIPTGARIAAGVALSADGAGLSATRLQPAKAVKRSAGLSRPRNKASS